MMQLQPSIIVTAGPSLDDENVVRKILTKNVSWIRFNMSHGSHKERLERYNNIKRIVDELKKDVRYFIDLQGPKIRVKDIENTSMLLRDGDIVSITSEGDRCYDNVIVIDIPDIHKHVTEGMLIFLHDGKIELEVQKIDGVFVTCKVLRGGELESRKGVNIPDALLPLDVVTKRDIEDLEESLKIMEIDGVALSFVRKKEDIELLRKLLEKYNVQPLVISKIETKQAINHIGEIMDSSDIIMYARGDLGVEIPAVKIPITQKEICKLAKDKETPVIVATQILTSMKESPVPTRAEMSDAIDALIDGATHLMLSDETTVGKHPFEAVTVLHDAIEEFINNQEEYKPFEQG